MPIQDESWSAICISSDALSGSSQASIWGFSDRPQAGRPYLICALSCGGNFAEIILNDKKILQYEITTIRQYRYALVSNGFKEGYNKVELYLDGEPSSSFDFIAV